MLLLEYIRRNILLFSADAKQCLQLLESTLIVAYWLRKRYFLLLVSCVLWYEPLGEGLTVFIEDFVTRLAVPQATCHFNKTDEKVLSCSGAGVSGLILRMRTRVLLSHLSFITLVRSSHSMV